MRILFMAASVLAGGEATAAPKLLVPITSGDQVGLTVKGNDAGVPGGTAMLGMWSDEARLNLPASAHAHRTPISQRRAPPRSFLAGQCSRAASG